MRGRGVIWDDQRRTTMSDQIQPWPLLKRGMLSF